MTAAMLRANEFEVALSIPTDEHCVTEGQIAKRRMVLSSVSATRIAATTSHSSKHHQVDT